MPTLTALAPPPLPLGEISPSTAQRLQAMRVGAQFVLADSAVTIFETDQLRVLQVGERVEMIDQRLETAVPGGTVPGGTVPGG